MKNDIFTTTASSAEAVTNILIICSTYSLFKYVEPELNDYSYASRNVIGYSE